MSPRQELPKAYDPATYEDGIYKAWEKSGAFRPASDHDPKLRKQLKPYTIVMPPPNVTSRLHVGHAMYILEDILIRYHRMKGFDTLYLPGTDHAAIATANMVDKELLAQGTDRTKIGRAKFEKRAMEYALEYKGIIENQLRALGFSADWSRNAFTMDAPRKAAVKEAFARLYKKGLIYRDSYMVNWCPACRTVLADDEVEHEEQEGVLYYMKYGPFELATTRPETKVGDTAVAVNPRDKRYKKYVGQTIDVQTINGVRKLQVIADEMVDPEFGTGVVKITPFHDANDYQVYLRYPEEAGPPIEVIGEDGTMTKAAGKSLAGLDRFAARKKIVQWLKKEGLLVREELHRNVIGRCYRSGDVIEPRISKQWFVKVSAIKEEAVKFVDRGELKFVPQRFEKTYRDWLEKLHDWCISRQIWFGHPVPAYINTAGDASLTKKTGYQPSTDTLDTWFSSALWPFSTMGWPKETPDFKRFFPNDVLETGYDIIFFWITRMVLITVALEVKNPVSGKLQPPYHTAYLHGLVRDKRGRKLSKSLGNGVDPLEMIAKYGTDALRFMLATSSTPGNDVRFDEQRVIGARNFANKLWNISRFIIAQEPHARGQASGSPSEGLSPSRNSFFNKETMGSTTASSQSRESGRNDNGETDLAKLNADTLTTFDRAILHHLATTARRVEAAFYDPDNYDKPGSAPHPPHLPNTKAATYDLGGAGNVLHSFIWSDFADWYLEAAKVQLKNPDTAENTRIILGFVLETSLKLLHPYMPFVTETIWQQGLGNSEPLITSPWPELHADLDQPEDAARFEQIKDIVETIRRLRSEKKTPAGAWIQAHLATDEPGWILESADIINRLARLKMLRVSREALRENAVTAVSGTVTISLPLAGLVDEAAETARLQAQVEAAKMEVERLRGRLANKDYAAKAPKHVVNQTKAALKAAETKLKKLESHQR